MKDDAPVRIRGCPLGVACQARAVENGTGARLSRGWACGNCRQGHVLESFGWTTDPGWPDEMIEPKEGN